MQSTFFCLFLPQEAAELPSDAAEAPAVAAAWQVLRYEYHVLYSRSFRVPVLYFRASFLGKTVPGAQKEIATVT